MFTRLLLNFGIFVFIVAVYYLIGKFLLKNNFSLPTFLSSTALALSSTIGAHCFLIFGFSNPKNNPLSYQSSVAGMILCSIAFIVLLCLYIIKRMFRPSVAGIITDVLFAISMIIPIANCFAIAYELISREF